MDIKCKLIGASNITLKIIFTWQNWFRVALKMGVGGGREVPNKQDTFTTCLKTCGTGSLFRRGSKSLWCLIILILRSCVWLSKFFYYFFIYFNSLPNEYFDSIKGRLSVSYSVIGQVWMLFIVTNQDLIHHIIWRATILFVFSKIPVHQVIF